MIYLYAALGVVMVTGIMAVVEMGLSLTGQSLLLRPDDPYQQNLVTQAVGKRDQQMLNLLHNQEDHNHNSNNYFPDHYIFPIFNQERLKVCDKFFINLKL